MAKQVVWSLRGTERKGERFWITGALEINQVPIAKNSINYSKIRLKSLQTFLKIGKPTDDLNTRIKIVRDYLIIYEETETQIFILTIWDSRQDPDKLSLRR